MSQSNPEFEIPEMPLPPEPPPEDEGTEINVNVTVASAVEWPAMETFDDQPRALEWAYYQNKAGGPKYFVHQIGEGKWEAIQLWLSNL